MEHSHTIRIRDTRPDDRNAVRALTLAAYEQYAQEMPHWKMYRAYVLATLDEDKVAERIVAEHDDEIVGSVLLSPAGSFEEAGAVNDVPEIRLLAVLPAARGRGVGAALLDECERRARAAGAKELGLHTEDRMAVAQAMYLRRGYQHVPALDFWPAEGVLVKGYRRRLDGDTDDA